MSHTHYESTRTAAGLPFAEQQQLSRVRGNHSARVGVGGIGWGTRRHRVWVVEHVRLVLVRNGCTGAITKSPGSMVCPQETLTHPSESGFDIGPSGFDIVRFHISKPEVDLALISGCEPDRFSAALWTCGCIRI